MMMKIVIASIFLVLSVYAQETLKKGEPSPKLIGRLLGGGIYNLKSDTGKAKVINFFSIQCKACRKEIPELAQLEKNHPNVKFISVHTTEESENEIATFIRSLPEHTSNIVVGNKSVKENFGYRALPYTIVLDENNLVVMEFAGYTNENMQQLKKIVVQMAQ